MKKIIKITVAMVMVLSLLFTFNLNVFAHHGSSWAYCENVNMFRNYGTRAYTTIESAGVSTDAYINQGGYTAELIALTEIVCDNIWYYADPYQHRVSSCEIVDIYGDVDSSYRRNITAVRSSWSPMPIDSEEVLIHSVGKTVAIFGDYAFIGEIGEHSVTDIAYIYSEQIHDMNHDASRCPICANYPEI